MKPTESYFDLAAMSCSLYMLGFSLVEKMSAAAALMSNRVGAHVAFSPKPELQGTRSQRVQGHERIPLRVLGVCVPGKTGFKLG